MIFCLAHLSKLGFGYSAVCVAWSANLNIIGVLWSSEDGQVLYERCIWTTDLSQHSHTWDVYIFHINFFNVVLLTTITEGTLSHKLVMVWPCWQASNVKQFISFLFDNMKFKHFFFIVFFFLWGGCVVVVFWTWHLYWNSQTGLALAPITLVSFSSNKNICFGGY